MEQLFAYDTLITDAETGFITELYPFFCTICFLHCCSGYSLAYSCLTLPYSCLALPPFDTLLFAFPVLASLEGLGRLRKIPSPPLLALAFSLALALVLAVRSTRYPSLATLLLVSSGYYWMLNLSIALARSRLPNYRLRLSTREDCVNYLKREGGLVLEYKPKAPNTFSTTLFRNLVCRRSLS